MQFRTIFTEKSPLPDSEAWGAFAARLPRPLLTARQVHGKSIVVFDKDYVYPGETAYAADQPAGDGLVTNQRGLFLAVKTADCVPILLWDEKAGVVAAVHAGWRGTALGIVGDAVTVMCRRFGGRAEDITAAIGPSVCGRCYEVGEEVAAAMPTEAGAAVRPLGGEKFLVDLPAVNTTLLRQMGVTRITAPTACTACDPHRYWSHRRHGTKRGWQLSIVGMLAVVS